ncbi:type III secretion system needle length determinant [Grimontia sp. NTOU-MAR1]|nr:type III secretion system needle length determinant [Grimontia sp. NTOU-MAR1]WRW00173.1 type III secretion system needle length determinant [Grimontia sp. NTOU-MAR1]
MRVKNDHPNTTERPQQVQQKPVNQVSEDLDSRFNNALKPKQAESEHESETLIASLPHVLKDQVLPIQRQQTKPSTVQSLLQGQLHKLDAAAHKLDPAAKDASAIVNSKVVDSKTTLSALEKKVKPAEHIELRHPSSESDARLHPTANLSQSIAQGDIILKNVESHAPQNRAQDVNELINKLVEKIYVSLPSANEKEVRLLLNEGQLKGGEISIKQDSSGYSVLIKQEHALSLINQTAKQELTERLQRLGIDQPIRIAVSEQMNQQQDQQRSRQQRNIYDEWKPEDE